LWAVEEKASKMMIGRVGLWQPEGWPGLEVGWTLLKSAWGKGYATEAGKASINYGFEVLKQPSLISLIDPENYPSQKVAIRLGMTVQKQIEVTGNLVLVYQVFEQQ
jgi:RimJ/RimL family protein N-acetyltransferase